MIQNGLSQLLSSVTNKWVWLCSNKTLFTKTVVSHSLQTGMENPKEGNLTCPKSQQSSYRTQFP